MVDVITEVYTGDEVDDDIVTPDVIVTGTGFATELFTSTLPSVRPPVTPNM